MPRALGGADPVAPRPLRRPEIGREDRGRAFDEHLANVGAENIWVAEVEGRVAGLAGMIPDAFELEPVVERERGPWVTGERIADREFRY